MPKNTATMIRDHILEYAAEHGHTIGKSKATRLAVAFHKRQSRMTDLELERIFSHSDPTPRDAFRNLAAQSHPLMAVAA